MDIVKVIGVGLAGVIITLLMNEYKKEYSILTSLITGVIILIFLAESTRPVISTMSAMLHTANMSTAYVEIIFKSIGICFITQIAVDTCKDSGNSAIASKIEMAGRIAILVISLPLFISLLELASSLISL